MALRVRIASYDIIAATYALGCNALTGADALAVDERESDLSSSSGKAASSDNEPPTGGPSSSGSSNGTSSSSSSSSSGGAAGDAASEAQAAPPSIIDETFAVEAACASLVVTNGGTTSYDPSGRSGAGACRICATTAGEMFAELIGTATKQGQATFEAYARRAPGASSPLSASIQLRLGGSSVTSSNNIGQDWIRLGGGSISVADGATVQLRVGVPNATAGECLVIDDARVAVP